VHKEYVLRVVNSLKHLVLICGVYYPAPSATGKCADQYVSLLQDEYDIDVIYMGSVLEDIMPHEHNGKHLFPQKNWRLRGEQRCAEKQFGIGVKLYKAIGRLQTYLQYPNNLRWFMGKAYQQLERIQKGNPIDVVFSVSSPFPAHLAAKKFKRKHPEIRWVGYTVDPHSSEHAQRPLFMSLKTMAISEAKCLSETDVCFLSEELLRTRPDLFDGIKSKTIALPYLLSKISLPEVKEYPHHFDENKINLVYAGNFYRDIRNPEFMLKTIMQIKDSGIVLHLFSSGNCDDIVHKYSDASGGRILTYELVRRAELLEIYEEADVLVSVANTTPEFSPSKIFEYVATGKPIIEFSEESSINPYLVNYPCTALVHPKMSSPVNEVDAFCKQNKRVRVSPSTIGTLYSKHMPSEVSIVLKQAINRE
jgi:glycosyltransferase involved in cell wall biosynthesis